MNRIAAVVVLSALGLLIGCGGGASSGGGDKQDITVSVGPKGTSVSGGDTQQFTATILNPHNTGVVWTLTGTGCTGAACGTLGNPGGNNNQGWTIVYTAPLTVPNPPTVTLTATSRDDSTKSDTITITLTAPVVKVSVAPATPTVILGATQQFTANVKGATNTAVTWSTAGPGTNNTSGLYTSPATLTTPASATVTATSQADTTKSGTATVTIPAVTVSVLPKVSGVILGATQQFTASVTNATNTAVTWTMSGPGGVDSTGLYTAPVSLTTPATATVRAASQADPSKSMSITFAIPAVTVGISPANPTVILGATQQFTASVGNAINTAVSWSMTGVGKLSSSGLYNAPSTLSTPSSATVMATSLVDPTKSVTTTVTIPAVGVTVAPPTISLNGGDKQTFTATVTNATDKTVMWNLTGLGTLSASGAYTAATVVPSQQTATVQATSNADPGKSGSAIVTLIPVSVSVSPSPVTVPINATQQFAAAVSGTTNKLVAWSVTGTGCSGDDCGTINSSGLYAAPDSIPNPPTVTVTATSAADPTKAGTAAVTITDNANSKLTGSFAFTFQGFLGMGMTAMIGSFTADGNGNLSNGLRDMNGAHATPVLKQAFTGTYQLHGDNRGVMTFTSLPGSPSFRFAINDKGDKGTFVEMDSTGTSGGGMFHKQITNDFAASKLTGNYAFGFYGNGIDNERNAAVGRLHTDGVGTISSGVMQTSSPQTTTFTGSFALSTTTGSANGRGTMSWSIASVGTYPGTFYMVSADRFFFLISSQVAIDSPLIVGEVRRQTIPAMPASFLNGAFVFYLNGLSSPSSTFALIGQFTANGSNANITGEYAQSDNGVPMPLQTFTGGIGVVGDTRVTLESPALGQFIGYMVDSNSGFFVRTNSANGAVLGVFEPQTLPVGGLKNSDLQGRYLVGGTQVAVSNGSMFTGYVNIDGAGNWTSTVDASSQAYPAADLYNAGTVSVSSSTTGRVAMTVTVPLTYNQVIYAASPDRLLVLDVDPSWNNQGALWQTTGFWEK
ncbi:MAG: hypothetical protein WA628_19425 [Terriglobales bacterium]